MGEREDGPPSDTDDDSAVDADGAESSGSASGADAGTGVASGDADVDTADTTAEPDDSGADVDDGAADADDGRDESPASSGSDANDANDANDVAPVEADGDGASPAAAQSQFEPGPSGPADDREMPLTEHIEEMLRRLLVVILVITVVSVVTFPFGEEIINFLWYSVLPGPRSAIVAPHLYAPLELLVTQIKVASLVGIILALPVFVYQTYRFMRPGLYPHERRYYLAAVPTSLILAFVGLVFGYFIVLPAVFSYFSKYTRQTAEIAFALGQTFNLILVLLGYMALVFQIPLFVMLAMMMGLVTRDWLVGRRLLFWAAFAAVSFFFSPDPTGVSPIIIAVTMISLFEGTLFLAQWTRAGQKT